jgi:hypothetical protein
MNPDSKDIHRPLPYKLLNKILKFLRFIGLTIAIALFVWWLVTCIKRRVRFYQPFRPNPPSDRLLAQVPPNNRHLPTIPPSHPHYPDALYFPVPLRQPTPRHG